MRVLDLFSGIGGFSLGLERAGMETVAFCEIEPFCQKVLKKHWPDVPIYEDVTELTDEQLKADGITGIDVITGGFPCQDISIAGKGKGIHAERSGLWSEYRRIIDDVGPKYAIVENVSALLNRGLSVVLGGLAEIGYDAAWTTFDSQYFGVPQRRRRVYILAVRDGIPDSADIFNTKGRSSYAHRKEVENIQKNRDWKFEEGEGKRGGFAYFTRQRSDEFACTGLSSTLAKRDYKSATDYVYQDGYLRRVTPQERMLLQGVPYDWMDGLGLTVTQQFICNGMTAPVITHIGKKIKEFDNTTGR